MRLPDVASDGVSRQTARKQRSGDQHNALHSLIPSGARKRMGSRRPIPQRSKASRIQIKYLSRSKDPTRFGCFFTVNYTFWTY
jgi:hypothetical protein